MSREEKLKWHLRNSDVVPVRDYDGHPIMLCREAITGYKPYGVVFFVMANNGKEYYDDDLTLPQ